jgi:hypothetical protein
MLIPIRNFLVRHLLILLRLAGLVSISSGLVGGYVWLVDLVDRSDGDSLRHGFWHNPFLQFPTFNEPFLDLSMWVLFACSAAAGLGGLMLLAPSKWGVPLVTWQARVSIVVNGVIALFIVAMMLTWKGGLPAGTSKALQLRLGSIAVDGVLWTFLTTEGVREFFRWQSQPAERAFGVIVPESHSNNLSDDAPDQSPDGPVAAAVRCVDGAVDAQLPGPDRGAV